MKIPLSRPFIDEDDCQSVLKTLNSGWLTQGPQVEELESLVANYLGIQNLVAVSNCTCALSLALQALNVGRGNIVICPSLSFIATANSIRNIGAEPFFCDVDSGTLSLSPQAVVEAIDKYFTQEEGGIFLNENPSLTLVGIVVVHQFGNLAPIEDFISIKNKYKLLLIEDSACAFGSIQNLNNRFVPVNGSLSDAACFSLHPRKIITCGEGGLIATSNQKMAEDVRMLRHHGMTISDKDRHVSKSYVQEHYTMVGYNYRLSDISAALAVTQVKKINNILLRFRENHRIYSTELARIPGVELINGDHYGVPNYQSICIRLKRPEFALDLVNHLRNSGIFAKRSLQPIHLESPYHGGLKGDLRNTESIAKSDILLPQFFDLCPQDINWICREIFTFFKGLSN